VAPAATGSPPVWSPWSLLCISVRCYCRIQQQEQAIEVSSVGNIVQYQERNVNMAFIEE
jgi:hypothetical protein